MMSNINTISQSDPLPDDSNDANGSNDAVNSDATNKDSANGDTKSTDTKNSDTWSDSREQLKKIVADVQQTTTESTERLSRIIQSDVFETLLETFTKASAVHVTLGDELKHAVESGEALPWHAVLKYRRGAQERVLSPINKRLGIQVSEQVYKSFVKLFSELEAGVADMPPTLSIPEPPSLYQPKEADTLWTRVKKAQVRSNRRMSAMRAGVQNGLRRLIGREKIPLEAPRLEVDLKMLLDFHVKVRIPEASTQEFNTIHSFLSTHTTAYEKAQTTWTYELLDIEQSLSIAFHELEELDVWLPDAEQTSQPITPDVANRLLAAVNLLQACLDQIVAHPLPTPELSSELLDACANELYQDFKCGDTFLLDDRSVPEAASLTASLLEESTSFWKTWYREVSDRIHMNSRLLELRDFLLKREKGLLNSIAKASIIPILKSFGRLRSTFIDVSQEVDTICEVPDSPDVNQQVLAKLQPLHQQISKQFKNILNDVTNLLRAGQALEEPGAIFWNDLHRFIDGLPELVEVHETLPQPVSQTESAKHRYQIRLQEIVQAALLKPLSNQLSRSAKSLQKAVINTWEETQQVEHMVDYNLKAAFAELKNEGAEHEAADALSSTQRIEENVEHDPVEVAHELITTGLSRSTEKLGELAKGLKKPWVHLADQAFIAIEAYSDDILHNILEEDNMNDRWTNFTMKVNRSFKKLGQLGELGLHQLSVYAGKVIKLGRRRTKQLIKKGQTAVGVVDQSEDQWLTTLELASDIDALHKRLPLVYRRLFSLKPLADLDLLEGRKLDVAFVKKHYAQWHNSQTGPLLLAMP
ncbi:MAG: hypothetical protein AB8G77_24925, partial [Rhodothermales bacterium]